MSVKLSENLNQKVAVGSIKLIVDQEQTTLRLQQTPWLMAPWIEESTRQEAKFSNVH